MNVTIEQKRLSTAEAELWIIVEVESNSEGMELRGHIAGPRCPSVQSVEIAYPIRTIRGPTLAANQLVGRIDIPEPNFWRPETPFTYVGIVELWRGEECRETKPISVAFRDKPN